MSNSCQIAPKTGACGTGMVCAGTSCEKACGNGTIDTGEECDPVLSNSWNCNSTTCKSTKLTSVTSYRKRCSAETECAPNEMCTAAAFLIALMEYGKVCVPKCFGSSCVEVPGYALSNSQNTQCSLQAPCFVTCASDEDCPPGVKCNVGTSVELGSFCAGPFY